MKSTPPKFFSVLYFPHVKLFFAKYSNYVYSHSPRSRYGRDYHRSIVKDTVNAAICYYSQCISCYSSTRTRYTVKRPQTHSSTRFKIFARPFFWLLDPFSMLSTQYYILIKDIHFNPVFNWVIDNDIPYELHANRLRFRPHSEQLLVQFLLQYSDHCTSVELPYPSVF